MKPASNTSGTAIRSLRGSVLVIVLVTLLFAAMALLAFVERAGDDLLVEARAADSARLRLEAYSALETTLAVLEDFRLTNQALRSPAEGWADPLAWSGFEASEGRTVEVTLADESGKLPLPNVTFPVLVKFFTDQGQPTSSAERLADAILGWSKSDHVATTMDAPDDDDYERSPLPFATPGRSLRSYAELASIDGIREVMFDEQGRPNALHAAFVATFSLYTYPRPNVNSAPPTVLAALGNYTEDQQARLAEYFAGMGSYAAQGPGYFRDPDDAATVLGAQAVAPGFATVVRALRITVTVREGRSSFQLQAVVAPAAGGATFVEAVLTESERTSGDTTASAGSSTAKPALNYPFKLLEIHENAAMPMTPPASAAPVS